MNKNNNNILKHFIIVIPNEKRFIQNTNITQKV